MRITSIVIALSLAACAADLELGEPTVSAVCLDDAPLSFAGDRTGSTSASIDLAPLDLEAPEDARVTLSSATMIAAGSLSGLEFAEHVRVSLLGTDAGAIDIADAVVGGAEVELTGDPDVDLGEHLRGGADEIEIAVSGDVPSDRWTVLVDLCFDVD